MKKFLFGLGIFFAIIVLVLVFLLGTLGIIPGLSSVLGTDKPRDLGVKFTSENLQSAHTKSQIEYGTLPDSNVPSQTRQFPGQRAVTAEFTSAEITATLNNQPWKFWPYRNMQVKFNADGSAEVSGQLLKSTLPAYSAAIGIPSEAVDFMMKYLPVNPVFYVKGRAALTDNAVSVFEPQRFEIGRVPIPMSILLASGRFEIVPAAFALDISGMSDDLGKVSNKRELIIDFINSRLSGSFGAFYAKQAYFGEDKLYFDGTLTEKILYSP